MNNLTDTYRAQVKKLEADLKAAQEQLSNLEIRERQMNSFLALRPQTMTVQDSVQLRMFLQSMTPEEAEQRVILSETLTSYTTLDALRKNRKQEKLDRIKSSLDTIHQSMSESRALRAGFVTESFERDLGKCVCGILSEAEVSMEEYYADVERLLEARERTAFSSLKRANDSEYAKELQGVAFTGLGLSGQDEWKLRDEAQRNNKKLAWRDLLESGLGLSSFSVSVRGLDSLYEQSLRDAEVARRREAGMAEERKRKQEYDQMVWEHKNPGPLPGRM